MREGVSFFVSLMIDEAVDCIAEDSLADGEAELVDELPSCKTIEDSDSFDVDSLSVEIGSIIASADEAHIDAENKIQEAFSVKHQVRDRKPAKRRPLALQPALLNEPCSEDVPEEPALPAGSDAPNLCLVTPLSVWFGVPSAGSVMFDLDFMVDLNRGLELNTRTVAASFAAAVTGAPRRRSKVSKPPALEMSLCDQPVAEVPLPPSVPRAASRPSTSLLPQDAEAAPSASPRAPAAPRTARRPSLHRARSARAESPSAPPPAPAAAPTPTAAGARSKGRSFVKALGASSRSMSSPKSLGPSPMSAMELDLGGHAARPRHGPGVAAPTAAARSPTAERPPLPNAFMKAGKLNIRTKHVGLLPALPGAASMGASLGGMGASTAAWRTSSGRSLSLDNHRLRLVT